MKVEKAALDGPLILVPTVLRDERGHFVELSRANDLAGAGIRDQFIQENQSRSIRGTLRGLHFQAPPGQAKLIRVARGIIHDVAVDLRPASPSFGRYLAVRLDDREHRQLYLPPGFAHGFCVLSQEADVIYRVSRYYDPALEGGLAWNDPDLAIDWPIEEPLLSARDQQNPRLRELELNS